MCFLGIRRHVDLNVFGLDPDDLAVPPRRHGITERFVQAPDIPRGLPQRDFDCAAVLEELLQCEFLVAQGSNPLAAISQVSRLWTRVGSPSPPVATSVGPVIGAASYSRQALASGR